MSTTFDAQAASEWRTLVEQLHVARERLGFSQRGLGGRLEMAEIVVGKWENYADLPSLNSFIRWSRALGLQPIVVNARGGGRPAADPPPRSGEEIDDLIARRLAAALKYVRCTKNLTQQEAGGQLGVSEWTVRMWETYRRPPRVGHLLAWSGVLGCRIRLVIAARDTTHLT